MTEPVTLYQFLHSPFNEKIRWALDFKNVAHRRQSLLPGPHKHFIRALTGGSTTTPLLMLGNQVLHESSAILATIEQRWPEPRLLPADATLAARCRDIEALFDTNYAPRMRRLLLSVMLQYKRHFAAVFGGDEPALQRFLYASMLWLIAPLIRKGNGIAGADSVRDGIKAIDEAFEWVTKNVQASGYLAGEQFSHADLVAAAHLAPFAQPDHPDTRRPQPTPKRMQMVAARWHKHPGAQWVREMYRLHRPQPRAL